MVAAQRDTNFFKVVVRVRPPLKREMPARGERDDDGLTLKFQSITEISSNSNQLTLLEYLGQEVTEKGRQRDIERNPHHVARHQFNFDKIYGYQSTQPEVYQQTAQPAVLSVLSGYNATIFAYGQTGTGKTYTMEGFKYGQGEEQRGIIPRSMEEIFAYISSEQTQQSTFMVRASYLQIYNETISDLLKVDRSSL